jgi:hypothetical protein
MNIHVQFGNVSSLKPLGQLKPNCPGMIIGRSSTKFLFSYADQKFKMAAPAVHRLTLDTMGKYSNAFPMLIYVCPAVVAILDFRSA